MQVTISMESLYEFLKSLSLGSENERWLAERLLDDVEAHKKPSALKPYTMEEIDGWIDEALADARAGRYLTEEEADKDMERFLATL